MNKLARVKAIQDFTDAEELVDRKIGDIFECSEERANVLTSYVMGEIAFPLVEVLEVFDAENSAENAEEYAEFVQPTGAHDSYTNGDKITYKGKKYICIIGNCVWSPETYPAGWEEVAEV